MDTSCTGCLETVRLHLGERSGGCLCPTWPCRSSWPAGWPWWGWSLQLPCAVGLGIKWAPVQLSVLYERSNSVQTVFATTVHIYVWSSDWILNSSVVFNKFTNWGLGRVRFTDWLTYLMEALGIVPRSSCMLKTHYHWATPSPHFLHFLRGKGLQAGAAPPLCLFASWVPWTLDDRVLSHSFRTLFFYKTDFWKMLIILLCKIHFSYKQVIKFYLTLQFYFFFCIELNKK